MRLIFAIFFTGMELTQPPAITYAWSQENIQAPQLLNAHDLLMILFMVSSIDRYEEFI